MIDDDDDPDENLDEAVSPETPVEDSASPKAYRAKQKDQAVREAERAQFWTAVMHSDVGRREMWGIVGRAFETGFGVSPVGFPDPHKTFFEAGQQDFAHRIFLTLLKHAQGGAVLMLQEHETRIKAPEPPRRRRKAE